MLRLLRFVFVYLAISSGVVEAHDLQGLNNKSMALSNALSLQSLLHDAESLADPDARYVYSRLLLWAPGQSLKSCFYIGSLDEKALVAKMVRILLDGKSVNISFDFGASPNFRSCTEGGRRSDVRVSFSEGCCAAYVGRAAHLPDVRDGPSVFLQGITSYEATKADQTVMHELLHALGLNHEHQSPDSVCQPEFIKDKVLKAYHWNEDQYETNLKQLDHDSRSYKWSEYDPTSIMKYFFDESFLKNGKDSPCYSVENYQPSTRDYEGLADAYPVARQKISPEKTRAIMSDVANGAPQAVRDLIGSLRELEEVDEKNGQSK